MKPFLFLITLLLTGCFLDENDVSQQKKCPESTQMMAYQTELITVSIPSMVSQTKLEITLPRCFFKKDHIKDDMIDNRIERTFVTLYYPLETFSDFPNNANNINQCPDRNKPWGALGIGPLWPIKIDGQEQLVYGNYWLKYKNKNITRRWFRLQEERNNLALYTRGVGDKLFIFVNQADNNSAEDIHMEFWPYNPDYPDNYMFPSQIDIKSVMHKEFSINYTVFASPVFHGMQPPVKGAGFADDLLTVYKHNESLLDHPEVLAGFINNNNNILKYLNQHIKIINPAEK